MILSQKKKGSHQLFYVWGILILLITLTSLLSLLTGQIAMLLLVCLAFLIKGVLVVNHLMGLRSSPKWIQFPMLCYFYFFSFLFAACFI